MIKNSPTLKLLTQLTIGLNIVFLVYFLLIHGWNVFYTKEVQSERKQANVLLTFIVYQFKKTIMPGHQAMSGLNFGNVNNSHQNLVKDLMNMLFNEDFIMNSLYAISLTMFFFFIFRDKNYRYTKAFFYMNLLMLCSNPINFIVVFNNHIENMGLVLYSLAFLICSMQEYELAILFYFIAQDLFLEFTRVSFLPFLALLIFSSLQRINIGKANKAKFQAVGRFLFDLLIYVAINFFVYYELDSSVWEKHKDGLIKNLVIHIKLLLLIVPSFAMYFIIIKTKGEQKDTFYKNFLMLALCFVVLLSSEHWWRVSLYFLLVIMNSNFMLYRQPTNVLLLYIMPLMLSMIWVEKEWSFLIISMFVQIINLTLIIYKNKSFKKTSKIVKIEKSYGLAYNLFSILDSILKINSIIFGAVLFGFALFLCFIGGFHYSILPFAIFVGCYYPLKKLVKAKHEHKRFY